jgi:phage tail-like protein
MPQSVPVGAYNFQVILLGDSATNTNTLRLGFSEVDGLDGGLDIETYREGGSNIAPLRFKSVGSYPALVLRRGVTDGTELWDWYADVLVRKDRPPRRGGYVVLKNATGTTVAAWQFLNGLPERLTGPRLDASQNAIAIEELRIAHEGLSRLDPPFDQLNQAIGG